MKGATAVETILKRRSIRKYTEQPIPEEMFTELLEAGMCAPSAGNERPWQFIVITERSLLVGITEIHEYSQMLKQAPAAIVVCADLTCNKYPGIDYWVQDCAAATENILLAAQDKGLGTCWIGVYPRKERMAGISGLLGLPEHVVPIAVVAVGYPAEVKSARSRYDASRVHRNCW